MSARNAVMIAERYATELRANEAFVRMRVPEVFDAVADAFVSATLAGEPVILSGDATMSQDLDRVLRRPNGDELWGYLQFGAQDAAQRRLWQVHRIVYDIDPHLWGALGETDTATPLPVDVFSKLPHPDPFIAFPQPLLLPVDEHTRQRISGFFVRGANTDPNDPTDITYTSTHHPNATAVGLTFGGEVETNDGQPRFTPSGHLDMIWSRVTLDPRAGDHTVGAMINAAVDRFHGSRDIGDWQRDIEVMMRHAVTVLVYLCADADLTPLPKQTAAGTGKKSKGSGKGSGKAKPSTPIGVGYRIGAALAAHRKRDHSPTAEPTGRHVAPHIRRAHFHSYKVGPGRQETVVKWLPPIPVNVTGDAERSTVIPVRKTPSTTPHTPASKTGVR